MNNNEVKKDCFGKYVFEDMDCMMCSICSSCQTDARKKELEYKKSICKDERCKACNSFEYCKQRRAERCLGSVKIFDYNKEMCFKCECYNECVPNVIINLPKLTVDNLDIHRLRAIPLLVKYDKDRCTLVTEPVGLNSMELLNKYKYDNDQYKIYRSKDDKIYVFVYENYSGTKYVYTIE